jgi:leucine dehydrogenase
MRLTAGFLRIRLQLITQEQSLQQMLSSGSISQLFTGEQLILCHDESVGLRAVIAIDDTRLGPAVGGVRFRKYQNETAALTEVHRLARTMTLKNAIAELPYGGAKSVIIQDGIEPLGGPARIKLMRRFGDFVARTAGTYIPGVDMGTSVEDLAIIGGSGATVSCSELDPSPWTAVGVASAIRAAVLYVDNRTDLEGVRILIQGVGHVGASLAHDLAFHGATVIVTDIDGDRAAELADEVGGTSVGVERALETQCDVFAPCAVARVVSRATIGRLSCRIIAGAANDILADHSLAGRLASRGITYVPDFVTNAGGVIHIHAVANSWSSQTLSATLDRIGDRVTEILEEAELVAETPLAVAEHRAERILTAAASVKTDGHRSNASDPQERLAA